MDPGLLGVSGLFGDRVEVGGDKPFLLEGDGLWLVEAGQVDVFFVRLEGGRPAGHRTHLFRVGPGRALFGLGARGPGDRGLLAVGKSGTRLHKGSPLALGSRATPVLGPLVDSWVEALCGGIAREVPPARCLELETGQELTVAARTSARPHKSVGWLRHVEGRSFLFGKDGLEINGHGFTPLSRRVWLETREPSKVILVDTTAVLDPGDCWAGLHKLHALVLQSADLLALQTDKADRERMLERTRVRRTLLTDACRRLASSMVPRASDPSAGAIVDHTDALFGACQLVGGASGVSMRPDPRPREARRDPLGGILKASRVRAREVALREDWWRHEYGPLLAYRAKGGDPVALLPYRGGYLLRDPAVGPGEPVTAAVAESLAPFAYSFYRGFGAAPLKVSGLLRFGLHGCRRDAWVILLVSLGSTILGMVPALATGVLFNDVIPGAQRSQVLQVTVVLLASALATALLNLTQGLAFLRIEGRMGAAVQSAVWDRLLSLPLSFFRPYSSGDLAVRAMSIDSIRQVISASTMAALMGGFLSLGNLGLMFYYSTPLALWASLIIAGALAITVLGSYLQLGPQRAAMRLQARTSGVVLQLLSAIGKLRAAGAEAAAFSLWARSFSEQRRLQFQARTTANWVAAVNAALPVAAYIFVFVVALPITAGGASFGTGDFLAFLAAFGACMTALLATCVALLGTLDVIPLYEQAEPILATLPEVDAAKSDPGVLSGDIEVQHARFRYQTDGPLVLREVSFRIKPGEFVAFVGPSGSGKSTLLRLLLGFETLESGAVYFDGQEIGGLDVQAVRRQMGVVLQSGRLMSGDIFTNIVGSAPATLEEAWEAARMAGLADDIRSFPMGMHTVISEGGGTLSGGQRQRLMIARAIVHRPRILLFDEATSALDNRTQAIVSSSLAQLLATRIVVAHRLSTIIGADQIFVMEAGRIVERGTYGELMKHEGLFAELARRQLA